MGEKHPRYGKKASIELRKKLSKLHKDLQAKEKHPSYKAVTIEEIKELACKDYSQAEVAKILNTTVGIVCRRLKWKGLRWENISNYKSSEKHRNRLAISHRGLSYNGGGFKIGLIPWNKGLKNPYSEKTLLKMSASHIGKPSGRKGKRLSEVTKGKISKNNGRGCLGKFGNAHPAFGNVPWNKGLKNCYTEDTVGQMRQSMINRLMTKSYTLGKGGFVFSNKNHRNLYYQSSYELKAIEILEKDTDVLHYDRARFSIEYCKDGGKKRYLPDFIVQYKKKLIKLIEVKPTFALSMWNNNLKIKAGKRFAKQNGMFFEVWTERELELMGE